MNRSLLAACVVLTVLSLAAWTPAAEPAWRAKGPSTVFTPDWSAADATDAAATAEFLKNVWPKVSAASKALDAKLTAKTGAVYAGPMSDAEKSAGAVCFPLKVEQVLPWYAVPKSEQIAQRKLTVQAARGQSEAVAIAVHATRDVKGVWVVCSDLVGPGGAKIPASAVTSRLSLSWTVDPRGRGRNIHARQMVLLNVPGWDIARGRTCEWVVDVHVPAGKAGDTAAGTYAGKITVTAGGKTAATFELSVEVLPFVLTDNGVRWGAFMTANPGGASEAWCDLNSRYGFNTLAWWNLDIPKLNWTWKGCKREETVLAKLRGADGNILGSKDMVKLPKWVLKRWDGTFLTFALDEVEGLPGDHAERASHYRKPMKLKAALGEIDPAVAKWVCYDRPGMKSNFTPEAIDSVEFLKDDAFKAFDAGMQRLKRHGFAGPVTWFGSGGPTVPWEIRVLAQRFGVKYSRSKWAWRREVTPENSNHTWYLANAAIAKTFDDARTKHGWPEVVWCPIDESFQYRGVSQRAAQCMVGEMMPYVRKYAPGMRIYMVVWHTKKDNWRGIWQCGVMQKDKAKPNGKPSESYGPYQVICTNCPNDLDRETTWAAGGEYWNYTFAVSTLPGFGQVRFAYGLNPARHHSALTYSFADTKGTHNLADGDDLLKTQWFTGQYTVNYYLSKAPGSGEIDYALASHQMLAARSGVTDRKYVETLRTMAHAKGSADDIAFLKALPARIDKIGGAGKGGVDDFTAVVTDQSAAEKLRHEIATRIKRLALK